MCPLPAITGMHVPTVEPRSGGKGRNGKRPPRSRRGGREEGTDRSTSCATVYNAGNTICQNLLPLDTHSRCPSIESAFSIALNATLAFAIRSRAFDKRVKPLRNLWRERSIRIYAIRRYLHASDCLFFGRL